MLSTTWKDLHSMCPTPSPVGSFYLSNYLDGKQVQAGAQASKSCHDELTQTLADLLDEFLGS